MHCALCTPSYWPLVGWIMGLTLQHSQVEAWEWLMVSVTGRVPQVKWEVKQNTPEASHSLCGSPQLSVLTGTSSARSHRGHFPFECRHATQFLSVPSLLRRLSFPGWSCPVSHWLPLHPRRWLPPVQQAVEVLLTSSLISVINL